MTQLSIIESINSNYEKSESKTTTGPDSDVADTENLERTWHSNFSLVSFPFFFLGFPVHLLFGSPGESKQSWKGWILQIFLPKQLFTVFMTLPLIGLTFVILFYTAAELWEVFHHLMILGKIDLDLIWSVILLVRILPAVIPLFATWLYGHTIRNLITSYDISRDGFKTFAMERLGGAMRKPNSMTLKLILIYLIVLCTNLIPLFTDIWIWSSKNLLIRWCDVMYSFVLPFYLMFVLGIRSQFQLLSDYLRVLVVENERPSLETLQHIKILFKRLVRQVVYVNDVFGLYLSWVIPAHAYTIGAHLFFLGLYFAGLISLATAYNFVDAFDLSTPELVRQTVANFFVMLLYIGLVCYTLWSGVVANDEIRFTQILLNDYLSDRDRDPPALLVQTDEVYKSARHLKFLVQSISKQQNPALLRIYIVGYFPWMNRRLHSPDLYHVVTHGRFLKEIV